MSLTLFAELQLPDGEVSRKLVPFYLLYILNV